MFARIEFAPIADRAARVSENGSQAERSSLLRKRCLGRRRDLTRLVFVLFQKRCDSPLR